MEVQKLLFGVEKVYSVDAHRDYSAVSADKHGILLEYGLKYLSDNIEERREEIVRELVSVLPRDKVLEYMFISIEVGKVDVVEKLIEILPSGELSTKISSVDMLVLLRGIIAKRSR